MQERYSNISVKNCPCKPAEATAGMSEKILSITSFWPADRQSAAAGYDGKAPRLPENTLCVSGRSLPGTEPHTVSAPEISGIL